MDKLGRFPYSIVQRKICMYKILGADQREYGPVTADQLRQWLNEGRLNAQSLARVEGTEGWKPLSQFPEFATALATATPPPTVGPGAYAVEPPTNTMAITGLVMGSVALACCQPVGILGIIFSAIALSQIKNNPAQKGKGLAIAGLILSIASFVILGVLVACGVIGSFMQQMNH